MHHRTSLVITRWHGYRSIDESTHRGVLLLPLLQDWSTRLRLPDFCVDLPPVVGRDGQTLDDSMVTKVICAIRARASMTPNAALRELRRWATPEARGTFAATLLERWATIEYDTRHRWVLHALAILGSPDTAQELERAIATWATSPSARHQRMVRETTTVLLHIDGGRDALRNLFHMSLPPRALSAITWAHNQLPRVKDDGWKDALNALSAPKNLPGLIKKGMPDLLDQEGEVLDKSWPLSLVRLCAPKQEHTRRRVVAQVRAHLDQTSLYQWVEHCVRCWRDAGAHGRAAWILEAVIAFGGPAAVMMLAEMIAGWPGQSDTGRKRAIKAMPRLREQGSDTAILCLLGLRQQAILPSVIEASEEEARAAARERKLSLPDLIDWITPDCGLDPDGSCTFDYGPRAFRLTFDDHMAPRFSDGGAVLDDLPEVSPTDDAELAEDSRYAWQVMHEQLRTTIAVQTHRLEHDMVQGRRWPSAGWKGRFLEHPAMVTFTRRLLWGVYDRDTCVGTFRAAEDLSLVDADDEPFVLDDNLVVGLVHVDDLPAETTSLWSDHFADYEVISPFPQLDRGPLPVAAGPSLDLDEQVASNALRHTLLVRGWQRDPSFHRSFYKREFTALKLIAVAHMRPGVMAGSSSDTPDQSITIQIHTRTPKGRRGKAVPLEHVPPRVLRETWRDLEEVRRC